MRSLLRFAILGVAVAIPAPFPQGMDFDVIDATPPPTETAPPAGAPDVAFPYSSASASAIAVAAIKKSPLAPKRAKRGVNDACAPQPSSADPPSGDNSSPSSFTSDPQFASLASNAPVPPGYDVSFINLQASTQQDGFLRLQTLDAYNPDACQELCDETTKCVAFNIYLERDPSLNPASNCSNPAPVTNVKCTLYGLPISPSTATNAGQYRQQFQVVIAASNGYNKDTGPGSIPGYDGPTPLACAINAPLASDGTDTYLGSTSFSGAFSPNMCADACTAQTQYDSQHPDQSGGFKTCVSFANHKMQKVTDPSQAFFNAYVLSENGVPQGTYCAFYTQHWGAQYAVNCGQDRGSDVYTVSNSYSYDLITSS